MLKLKNEDGRGGWVKVSLKYIPVEMKLDASESINNMGKLRVDILDGVDLPSADRNGKSDPYCKFELNGQDVYKTKVQKKTLSPTWNEFFEVSVPSRTGAKFKVNVYDYDFADKPDFLGASAIRLDELEPFKASEQSYKLDGKSGSVRVRMLFKPDYVTRTRQGTSTFQGTFAAPTKIVTGVAGVPIKGGVAVAGAVGHGVGKGASFLRRGILGKKDKDDMNGSTSDLTETMSIATSDGPGGGLRRSTGLTDASIPVGKDMPIPSIETPAGNSPSHNRTKSIAGSSIHSALATGVSSGTATFTVIGANGYPPSTDLYIAVVQVSPKEKTVGKTKHFKASDSQWNFDESFKFACAPDAQFKVEARHSHTFGSDDDLGEHAFFVDETGAGSPKELSVGSGMVTIKSSFQPSDASSIMDSPKSSLRRSLLSKRESRISRDSTPNP